MNFTTSALSKLLEITIQIRTGGFSKEFKSKYKRSDGYYMLGPAICSALERPLPEEGYSIQNMFEDYSEILKICSNAIEYVEEFSPKKALSSNKNIVEIIAATYK